MKCPHSFVYPLTDAACNQHKGALLSWQTRGPLHLVGVWYEIQLAIVPCKFCCTYVSRPLPRWVDHGKSGTLSLCVLPFASLCVCQKTTVIIMKVRHVIPNLPPPPPRYVAPLEPKQQPNWFPLEPVWLLKLPPL